MASYYIVRPLCTSHLFYPSPSSHDRVCCTGLRRRRRTKRPIFTLRYRHDLGLWTDLSSISVQLAASSARFNGVVLPHCNLPGQVNAVADASVAAQLRNPRFEETDSFSDDESLNGAPVDPTVDPGPDFDYALYAMNTMEDFVVPPEPRIPFGGPFEDYYDEYIGVDYVPKQEKPTSSFLMFLDSLNQKRAEEEAKLREKDPSRPPFDPKPNKHLFDDKKPLFTLARPTHPAPPPRPYTPPTPGVREEKPWLWREREEEPSPYASGNVRRVTEPLNKPLISQSRPIEVTLSPQQSKPGKAAAEQISMPQQPGLVEEYSPITPSPVTTRTPDVRGDTSRPSSPQTVPEGSRVSGRILTPQLRTTEESLGGMSLSPSTRPLEGTSDVSCAEVPAYRGSRFAEGSKPTSEATGPGSMPSYSGNRIIEERKPPSGSTGPTSIPSYPGGRPFEGSKSPLEETGPRTVPSYPGSRFIEGSTPPSEVIGSSSVPSYPGSGFIDGSKPPSQETGSVPPYPSEAFGSRNVGYPSYPGSRLTEGSKQSSEASGPNIVPSYPGSRFIEGGKPPSERTGPSNVPSYPGSRFIEGSKPPSETTRPSSVPSYPGSRFIEGSKPPSEAAGPSSLPSYPGSRFTEGSKPPMGETGPSSGPPYTGSRFIEGSRQPAEVSGLMDVPSYPESRFTEGSRQPMETTTHSGVPSYPGSRFIEASKPSMEATRASGMPSYPGSSFLEGSKPPIEATRPLEEMKDMKPSFPAQFSETKAAGEERDIVNGSGKPLFPQSQPVEVTVSLSQSRQVEETFDSGKVSVPQVASSASHIGEALPKSQYYEPKEGDIVLGVVIYSCDDELDLEIGSEFPGLMTMRDFQPLDQLGDKAFFKLPSNSETYAPPLLGKSFLVEDKAANDGIYRGNLVDVGTVVLAEVQSRALIDGRALLACRRLARSLGFLRIEQLRRTGEPIQIEIVQCNDGGLQGYLEGVRAFLPRSELLKRPENMAVLQDYIGKTLTVAVVQAEEQASNVIISEVKPWMSENLLLGTVHDLTVTRIYPYGMQVEINNTRIRGFIHISNITRGYVTSISNSFVEGDKVRAMVIRGRKPGQISFSIEALEPETDPGLVLRDKEQVFQDGDEFAKTTEEYQLSIEERRIFSLPAGPTNVNILDNIANLPWLQFQDSKNSS